MPGFSFDFVRPFDRANVLALNENQTGVYSLLSGSTVVYVGRGDIRERLLSHLRGENSCINSWSPARFTAEVTAYPISREKELIEYYDPPCNKKVG